MEPAILKDTDKDAFIFYQNPQKEMQKCFVAVHHWMELSLSSTLENSKPRPFALESVLSFPRLKSIDFHYFQTLLITWIGISH